MLIFQGVVFALRLECLQQSSSQAAPHRHPTTPAPAQLRCRHAAAPHATAPCDAMGWIADAEENGEAEEPWQ